MRSAATFVLAGLILASLPMLRADDSPARKGEDAGANVPLRLSWKENILTISGGALPGGELKALYLEAYCRAGSTERKWGETVIGHKTRLVSADADGHSIKL